MPKIAAQKSKKNNKKGDPILEKMEYIGLELEVIPEEVKYQNPLEFRVPKFYDDKQYRQYRYLTIDKIQILLSPTNRLEELSEKYKKARPLYEYLDGKNEKNVLKYATFLNMLKEVKIEDIEKVEKEQLNLMKKQPFKVKYNGNYLWQIYYDDSTDQYFMLVPIEDANYSTFFYLLKQQLTGNKNEKIFVPINNVEYSRKYLRKSEFEDMENYLWMFTKDWPCIYEVYDKQDNLSIEIVGETNVYEKIKSIYHSSLHSAVEANKFHKLLKALFILQTELPHYYEFKTSVGENGDLEFFYKDEKIEYEIMPEFIKKEYKIGEEKKNETLEKINDAKKRLKDLKQTTAMQEMEYLEKEKQISTFLECKKTFFGKFKYYFKYSKKNKRNKMKQNVEKQYENLKEDKINVKRKKISSKKENYTIEELIENYKELETIENTWKNIILDINALKLKNKNMAKKIENASKFIEDIDRHKKSIFEFWKYSNKDEVAVLPEGEEEEVNVIKKISKVFDYEGDIERFGKNMDRIQRANLSKEETDCLYIVTTNVIEILNKMRTGTLLPKDIQSNLKQLKQQCLQTDNMEERQEFDIFGGMLEDPTKIKKLKDKKHRENPKNMFNILEITNSTKSIGYKLALEQILQKIQKAIAKIQITEELAVYKAIPGERWQPKALNICNINPEIEIKQQLTKTSTDKIYFYKVHLKEGARAIVLTNSIFYDNQNKTLPLGMDLSTQVLIEPSKLKLKLKEKSTFKIATLKNEKDDFSDVQIKSVIVLEYEMR